VDREAELTEIARVIRNRGKLFLIGPRRFGKTSLLAAAAEDASRAGTVVLRFDAEKYETLPLLASAILTAAVRSLQGPVEKLAGMLGRAASRLRPMVEVDPLTGSLSVAIGASLSELGALPLLAESLDAVESLAAESGRDVVVVLDEVQQVVVEHGEAAERQLRATVQGHRHVGYIFAGSATRLLTAMTTDANRPFYRLGAITFLGPVPAADFLAFLEEGFRASGFAVVEGGCARILERADGVPYNVQRLAHEAWEMLRAGEASSLDPAVVDGAVERIVAREDPAYTQLWTSLTTNQKKALKAAIALDGRGLQSGEAGRRFDISPASVQVALAALEDRHLLRRDTDAGGRYRLVDPFLAAWLLAAQSV
jgi:DNA-binding IclR family transcriptional regulator